MNWILKDNKEHEQSVQIGYFGQKSLDTKSLIKRKILSGELASDRDISLTPEAPSYRWSVKKK